MPRLLAESAQDRVHMPVYLERGGKLEGHATLALRTQYRRCGKPNCIQCPHGPYAYAVVPRGAGSKLVYLGVLAELSLDLAPARTGTKIARTAAKARRGSRRKR